MALSVERLERARQLAHEFVDSSEMPMAALRVAQRGETLLTETYGASANQQTIEADIFRVYSMTKPLTAVAALILYERGFFNLGDPVSAYIPEFADVRVVTGGAKPPPRPADALCMTTEPLTSPLTILHLFTHTAGLHSGNINPEAKTLEEYASTAAMLPLLFTPGTQFRYCKHWQKWL